jgi:hypothetical protein
MLDATWATAHPTKPDAEGFSLFGQFDAASSSDYADGYHGDLAFEFFPGSGSLLSSRCEVAWASVTARLLQVTRFIHDDRSCVALPPSLCDVGSDARNFKNVELAASLNALVPCGSIATSSSFLSHCLFITVEEIETRCSPFSTVLPPGSRGEVIFIDADGDALVRFPAADWLNDGNPLCIPIGLFGRCRHLMRRIAS